MSNKAILNLTKWDRKQETYLNWDTRFRAYMTVTKCA